MLDFTVVQFLGYSFPDLPKDIQTNFAFTVISLKLSENIKYLYIVVVECVVPGSHGASLGPLALD